MTVVIISSLFWIRIIRYVINLIISSWVFRLGSYILKPFHIWKNFPNINTNYFLAFNIPLNVKKNTRTSAIPFLYIILAAFYASCSHWPKCSSLAIKRYIYPPFFIVFLPCTLLPSNRFLFVIPWAIVRINGFCFLSYEGNIFLTRDN